MVEEKKTKVEKEMKVETKVEETKVEETNKVETKVEGAKVEDKKSVVKAKVVKKDVAIANGFSLRISPKQSIYVCRVIMGKSPEAAVKRLEDVISEKRIIPMAGLEVGHKKGKGLAGGRFPKNACKAIIEIVKQAGANAVVNGIENPVISIAKADRAAAPLKKGGRKAKRAHIHIEMRERKSKIEKKESGGKK